MYDTPYGVRRYSGGRGGRVAQVLRRDGGPRGSFARRSARIGVRAARAQRRGQDDLRRGVDDARAGRRGTRGRGRVRRRVGGGEGADADRARGPARGGRRSPERATESGALWAFVALGVFTRASARA